MVDGNTQRWSLYVDDDARTAFRRQSKRLLEKHAIAPSAATLCCAPTNRATQGQYSRVHTVGLQPLAHAT